MEGFFALLCRFFDKFIIGSKASYWGFRGDKEKGSSARLNPEWIIAEHGTK